MQEIEIISNNSLRKYISPKVNVRLADILLLPEYKRGKTLFHKSKRLKIIVKSGKLLMEMHKSLLQKTNLPFSRKSGDVFITEINLLQKISNFWIEKFKKFKELEFSVLGTVEDFSNFTEIFNSEIVSTKLDNLEFIDLGNVEILEILEEIALYKQEINFKKSTSQTEKWMLLRVKEIEKEYMIFKNENGSVKMSYPNVQQVVTDTL